METGIITTSLHVVGIHFAIFRTRGELSGSGALKKNHPVGSLRGTLKADQQNFTVIVSQNPARKKTLYQC